MASKLFDCSDSSDNEEPKIKINEEFARRFEYNKKREDLQRYEELKKKGVIDSESDSEDDESSEEDDLGNSSKNDLVFFDALIKVKKQDPALKDKEAKLFDSESKSELQEEEEIEKKEKKKKKKKPMYLKDVTAKHLIEEGPEFEEGEEKKKSYVEEQEQLRRAFLDAVEADDDDDDEEFLKVKKHGGEGVESDDGGFQEKLDEYFGEDEKLDENEMFLKEYFKKKMWLDKGDGGKGEFEIDVSEDEEEIEKQEDYEREFNFRYEENAGDRVLGHSRVVEDSVRKKTNARKLQRQSKEERMAQAEFERKEELKRLKNLKKKEINEKLKKIRETAGFGDDGVCLLDENDLEEEFDPDEYDKKMKKAFGDGYYEANDADPGFGSDSDEDGEELEKPDFDKEDELLGLSKGWDDLYGSGDGFTAARERALQQRVAYVGDDKEVMGEEEVVSEEGKMKKKRKRSDLEEEVLKKGLEEYYELDYEDTIGDLKTRFKYKPVKSKRYGLSTKEVLLLDDKELNQYVSLKKLAPYVEKEWKVPYNKRLEIKQRSKSLLEVQTSFVRGTGRKTLKGNDKKSTELLTTMKDSKLQSEGLSENQNGQSRGARRRRNQADLKLSHSRLAAYGKLPSKSKTKSKKKN